MSREFFNVGWFDSLSVRPTSVVALHQQSTKSCVLGESFIRLLMLDGRETSVSCIYCSGISDLKAAVRNGRYKLLIL